MPTYGCDCGVQPEHGTHAKSTLEEVVEASYMANPYRPRKNFDATAFSFQSDERSDRAGEWAARDQWEEDKRREYQQAQKQRRAKEYWVNRQRWYNAEHPMGFVEEVEEISDADSEHCVPQLGE